MKSESRQDTLTRQEVVGSSTILNRDLDSISPTATFAKIIVLEILSGLCKPITVREVMDGVDDVEGIDACGVQILSGGRNRSGAVGVVQDLRGRRLDTTLSPFHAMFATALTSGIPFYSRHLYIVRHRIRNE
jgi:hypothetical protein